MKYLNSWIVSVAKKVNIHHYYFCSCSNAFTIKTALDVLDAPDILCPICANDYFKDATVFKSISSTKIWKYFRYKTVKKKNYPYWIIELEYDIPSYNPETDKVRFQKEKLLTISFKKASFLPPRIEYNSKIVLEYSLYLDEKVQSFQKLLLEDARLTLYDFILSDKEEYRDLAKLKNIEHLSLKEKLASAKEIVMFDSILEHHQERSIKKALYTSYKDSLKNISYYPYSDYIFSRSIENTDLLLKLLKIDLNIKRYIFIDETVGVAEEFIRFLKTHYTEKQIVKMFIESNRDELYEWRDTLRILNTPTAQESLQRHFLKVKPTITQLHDEILRVFNVVRDALDIKVEFDYNKRYLNASALYKELEFRLPYRVQDLSLWAIKLHNCMSGYAQEIHLQKIAIYGVFKENKLLYAIEVNSSRIVQAKANMNAKVPNEDMSIIKEWYESNFSSLPEQHS